MQLLQVHDPTGNVINIPGYGIILAHGDTVPTSGTAGYAHGCQFIMDGGDGISESLYINAGDQDSSEFHSIDAITTADASIGLTAGSGVDNAAAWTAAMNDPTTYYREIDLGGKAWYFGTSTVHNPMIVTRTARKITGTGIHKHGTADSSAANQSFGTPSRIIYGGPKIYFNGTSVTATATSGGSILTLTGWTGLSSDVGMHVVITGGTNFIVSNHDSELTTGDHNGDTYVVTAATSTTWTLDRACTSGGAGSGMTGYASGTLVQDISYGGRYEGLYLAGRAPSLYAQDRYYTPADSEGPRGFIGWHVITNYDDGPAGGLNTGKHHLCDMVFTNFEIGVMAGRDARGAHDAFATYTGESDNHADHLDFDHIWFDSCRTGLYIRTSQNVATVARKLRFTNDLETAIYFERGGRFSADGIEIGGEGPWTLLTIGDDSSGNSGYFKLSNVTIDAASTAGKIKLLKMAGTAVAKTNRAHTIIFDGGIMPTGIGAYEDDADFTGLFDVMSAQHVIVQGWKGLRDKIFRMIGSTHASTTQVPHATIRDCWFTGVSTMSDIVDSTNSSDGNYGWRVDVINCKSVDGTLFNGVITHEGVSLVPAISQPAPNTANDTTELTPAKVLGGIITSTQSTGANMNIPLPAGATLDAAEFHIAVDQGFDWVLQNLSAAAADTVTLTATAGHSVSGVMVVQSAHSSTGGLYGNSARFRTRKTAANTYVTYRA